MKIKFVRQWSVFSPGQVADLGGGVASALVDRGIAERFSDVIETNMLEPRQETRPAPQVHPRRTHGRQRKWQ